MIRAALIALLLVGCATPRQRSLDGLHATSKSVSKAFMGYLRGVSTGQISTNEVRNISGQYREFQALFSEAAAAAVLSTNSPPPVEMLNSGSQLLLTIQAAHIISTSTR